MPAQLLQPGVFYHVYTHANGSENLFRSEENYRFFLQKYALHIAPVASTFAYCLMPNHVHFLIRVKDKEALEQVWKEKCTEKPFSETFQKFQTSKVSKNLGGLATQAFSNLFNSYTKSYNKVYNRKGSLFIPNFKKKPIENDSYFTKVVHYIHANPVHHGFVPQIEDWPHSSYHSLLSARATQLERETVLSWFYGKEAFIKAHQQILPL